VLATCFSAYPANLNAGKEGRCKQRTSSKKEENCSRGYVQMVWRHICRLSLGEAEALFLATKEEQAGSLA
jgi:hypothetical protein